MKAFLLSLQFLTVIMVKRDLHAEPRDLVRSAAFFPLIGLIIGLILAGAYALFSRLWLPIVADALTVVLLVVLTRGFHLDGLADTCDGLLGSYDRQRSLEIMKDSRVGVFGVAGIVCVLLLKVMLLTAIPSFIKYQVLVVMPVVSRWSMTQLAWRTPYAREKGLGGGIAGRLGSGEVLVALVTAFTVSSLLMRTMGLIALGVATLITLLVRAMFMRKLGGVTGDSFGFVNEINETIFLLTASAFVRYYAG